MTYLFTYFLIKQNDIYAPVDGFVVNGGIKLRL